MHTVLLRAILAVCLPRTEFCCIGGTPKFKITLIWLGQYQSTLAFPKLTQAKIKLYLKSPGKYRKPQRHASALSKPLSSWTHSFFFWVNFFYILKYFFFFFLCVHIDLIIITLHFTFINFFFATFYKRCHFGTDYVYVLLREQ